MQATFAIPAYPKPLKVKQADGSWITIQMYGDEHGHYVMTSDGIPLVFNAQLRNYEYADWKNGEVQASGIKATEASEKCSGQEVHRKPGQVCHLGIFQACPSAAAAANPFVSQECFSESRQQSSEREIEQFSNHW